MGTKDNVLLNVWNSIQEFWTDQQRKKFILIFILFLISAMLDVIGLASFVPLVVSLSEPSIVESNAYFAMVYKGIGFESIRNFYLVFILSILGFFILKNAYGVLVNRLQVRFAVGVGLQIAKQQYNKYANTSFATQKEVGSGKIINYVNNTPFTYVTTIVMPLFNFLSEAVTFLIITIGIAVINPTLFLFLAGFVGPATVLFYRSIRKKSQHIGHRIDELIPDNINNINDAFKGFVELRLYQKHHFFKARFLSKQEEIQRLNGLSTLFTYMTPKVTEVVAVLGVVIIFGFGVISNMVFSELLALVAIFAGAAYRLMPSLNRIIAAFISLKKYQYTIRNLFMHRKEGLLSKIENDPSDITFTSKITLKELGFSYGEGEPFVLKNISNAIQKGERIGLIGASGAGKTTFANVLLGLYPPTEGSFAVDNKDITPKLVSDWQRLVGYVKQDGFIMHGTIAQNVTLGASNPDEQAVLKALERASLWDVVQAMPKGLHTDVGEGGNTLSGGQRQRLAIARALYHGAEFLVFDEATSALDGDTEKEITQAIEHLSRDITMLIIAHRHTTLKGCDRIWDFSDGSFVERTVEEVLNE